MKRNFGGITLHKQRKRHLQCLSITDFPSGVIEFRKDRDLAAGSDQMTIAFSE